ncbi:class I SAM-dependent methyltransferase [Pseudonocardia spinosispora]|uniref:class I SAM-dependent methyltransferase n=1 Tax=Pseudonocardia spinosispora TaxID=103441 RepID=UPI0003FA5028|nr:class I SAM-dependent methyltransferase [Pseudonocardia spinosispora]
MSSDRWERLVSSVYDPFLWLGERRGMRDRRAALLRAARGRTLEIGAGTGLNLPHYPSDVDELLLTEPSPAMASSLHRRVSGVGRPATVLTVPATELPVEDSSVDTVVSTLVLCTVPDASAALAEIARVLRPGGHFLFCEHILSDRQVLAAAQRRLARPWAAFAIGCRCDRPLLDTITSTLRLDRVEHSTWRGMPPLVRPLITGSAVR